MKDCLRADDSQAHHQGAGRSAWRATYADAAVMDWFFSNRKK